MNYNKQRSQTIVSIKMIISTIIFLLILPSCFNNRSGSLNVKYGIDEYGDWCEVRYDGAKLLFRKINYSDEDGKGPFWLSETEITHEFYYKVLTIQTRPALKDDTGDRLELAFYDQGGTYPVNYISWNECHKFINSFNKTGVCSWLS